MKLCMFHPVGHPLERGWVGRFEGDSVTHLAAQTLQSFFTGGGAAREHAVYALDDVCLLAPVLHPPAVRVFEDQGSFVFANPAAIVGPRTEIHALPQSGDRLSRDGLALHSRLAGVIGADGAIAGFTSFAEWRRPGSRPPKDRDFALGLGPVLVTPDELDPDGLEAVVRVEGRERSRGTFTAFDWDDARDLARAGTSLRPGDLLAGPGVAPVTGISAGRVGLEVDGIGVLDQVVVGA